MWWWRACFSTRSGESQLTNVLLWYGNELSSFKKAENGECFYQANSPASSEECTASIFTLVRTWDFKAYIIKLCKVSFSHERDKHRASTSEPHLKLASACIREAWIARRYSRTVISWKNTTQCTNRPSVLALHTPENKNSRNEKQKVHRLFNDAEIWKHGYNNIWFEVLMAVTMDITVFRDVTPCSLTHRYQRFRETYCIHLQGSTVIFMTIYDGDEWKRRVLWKNFMPIFGKVHKIDVQCQIMMSCPSLIIFNLKGILFFLVSLGGVRLSTLGTSATIWPIVPTPDDRWWWVWSSRWNENWQGKPKYSEKTCPSSTLSTTNPTWSDLGWNPGRRGGKPATNRLSYDTASKKALKVCQRNLVLGVHIKTCLANINLGRIGQLYTCITLYIKI
jgi:hypothetical protein